MRWRSASELGQKYATKNYPSQGTQICKLHGPSIKPRTSTLVSSENGETCAVLEFWICTYFRLDQILHWWRRSRTCFRLHWAHRPKGTQLRTAMFSSEKFCYVHLFGKSPKKMYSFRIHMTYCAISKGFSSVTNLHVMEDLPSCKLKPFDLSLASNALFIERPSVQKSWATKRM